MSYLKRQHMLIKLADIFSELFVAVADSELGKITHGNLPISNKLFDWEHALPDANDPLRFRLPRVGVIAPQGNKFSFERSIGNAIVAPRALFMVFDTGLSTLGNYTILSSFVARIYEYKKNEIDKIESRLLLELQEFINLFSMPKLDIIGKPKDFKFSYDEIVFYTFELPTFEPGLSDIQYCFYTQHPLKYIYNSERRPDERLNKLFNIAKKDAIRKMTTKDGVQTIAIPMEARQIYASQLEWYYILSKEIIVPMRILNDKGELNSEYTIGMINKDVK
ncbi:hypothetical protein SJZ84_10540 [Hafnia paralvei]|uniref:hypothetical protein n=1 Tax=Hafnia paralvei TaxID=546367 RepID=UPI0026DBD5FB|nr:hypothetical protein [Hafnia paralvei]MDX6911261.1 hypothetical protein [Hafnia paralvei]